MTEQQLKELKAEIENSGIPKQSQEMIIDACGKQVGKKPIRKPNQDWTFEEITCPTCGMFIGISEHHCRCGQKLDWSDDNEVN